MISGDRFFFCSEAPETCALRNNDHLLWLLILENWFCIALVRLVCVKESKANGRRKRGLGTHVRVDFRRPRRIAIAAAVAAAAAAAAVAAGACRCYIASM